ncbi:MAG: PTS fructose transporter subunit IIC [Bacillota bacterium]
MKKGSAYRHLMSGVSHMIPFVVAGGILIALSFLVDVGNAGAEDYGSGNIVASWFGEVGNIAFGFMLPILAGYIAYSIADRPGFVPGFVGGALANEGGSDFLGAILIGFVAGFIVFYMKKLFSGLPRSMAGILPVLVFPLFGTILVALAMIPIDQLVTPLQSGLESFLNNIEGTSAFIVGLIAGGMMAVDMGGPVNKAAYVVGIGTLGGGASTTLMAAVMAGGMVPPLGIALATVLFKNKFNQQQVEAGKTNWVMGLSFITEGAIPFAAANPKVVIPSIIAGSATAGAIVGLFGAASPAPHGGIFVLPVMDGWFWFLIALAAGTVLTAFLLKAFLPNAEEETEEA